LSQITEPQPDVAVLKPRTDFYRHRQPTGSDTLLLVEVSESTLRYDREVKVPLYARLGVPEVWIIDLEHDRILFYRSRSDDEYVIQTSTERPGVTPVPGLSDVAIDLSRLLSA
jgi:Uma2 family endonuclease